MKININSYKRMIALAALLMAASTALSAAEATKPSAKPNILFILVDDMAYNGISSFGGEKVKTPHIDSLAEGGMKFTHAYAMPQCSPNPDGKKSVEQKHFADMTAYTDKLIGTLVAKLDELKLRDNTLVPILGDNGTAKSIHSKFLGRDVTGGKHSSTPWGTRVPGIANWPGRVVSAKVCSDLIDTTDFLPTICEVTGTKIPSELEIDGRSFLLQLLGEKGNPREWLYAWYGPRGGAKPEAEFAHDENYWLFTDGRFYAVRKNDTFKKAPLPDSELDDQVKGAKAKLQAALKTYDWPCDDRFVKQFKEGTE